MARSPFLAKLRRIAHEVRAAKSLGIEHGEWVERRAKFDAIANERGLTRRDFLAGASASALLLGLPTKAFAAKNTPRIAIVGGGIAGLSAALTLRDSGFAATIYESQTRIGGRMFSRMDSYFGGQTIEWCGELIDTGHATIRKLAKRFHLDLVHLPQAEPKKSEDTNYFDGGYYTQAQVTADFLAIADLVFADVDAAGYPTKFDHNTPEGIALDQMSVRDWIDSRVPGGHTSLFGQYLDIAYNGEYSAQTTDQSSLNLLYLLGFQPKPNALSTFGESDERMHIDGGNERLPKKIAKHLGEKSLKLEHSLTAISQPGDGTVHLTFDTPGGSKEVIADFAILTLPFAVLQQLDMSGANFEALKLQAINSLGKGRGGKLQLQFDSRVWNAPGAWGPHPSNGATYTDLGYQSTWDVTRGQKGKKGILNFFTSGTVADAMATTVGFADASTPSVLTDVNTHLPNLEIVLPGVAAQFNGLATSSLPHLFPHFNLTYSYYRVGQYTTFGGMEKKTQGRVLFAGEHTSTNFQGYMEGGATEGVRAAKELLSKLS